MLIERHWDHCRLSLLTIFLNFLATWTGLEVEQFNSCWDCGTLCASFSTLPNTTYKLWTFTKYYGRKKFNYNTYNSLCSTQWLLCHPLAADHDFSNASLLSRKKKVCKQPQQFNTYVLLSYRRKAHYWISAEALVRACRPSSTVTAVDIPTDCILVWNNW